jgi:hypothetical protein
LTQIKELIPGFNMDTARHVRFVPIADAAPPNLIVAFSGARNNLVIVFER